MEFVQQLETLIDEYKDSIDMSLIGFNENWKKILTDSNPTIQ